MSVLRFLLKHPSVWLIVMLIIVWHSNFIVRVILRLGTAFINLLMNKSCVKDSKTIQKQLLWKGQQAGYSYFSGWYIYIYFKKIRGHSILAFWRKTKIIPFALSDGLFISLRFLLQKLAHFECHVEQCMWTNAHISKISHQQNKAI